MIDRGLIELVPGPGRAIHHRSTAHGETLRHAGDSIVDQVFAASFAPLRRSNSPPLTTYSPSS